MPLVDRDLLHVLGFFDFHLRNDDFQFAIFVFGVNHIPIAIFYFDGWWRFFKLNLERGEDFGSIWYGLSLLNIKVSNLDLLYPLISLILFALLAHRTHRCG